MTVDKDRTTTPATTLKHFNFPFPPAPTAVAQGPLTASKVEEEAVDIPSSTPAAPIASPVIDSPSLHLSSAITAIQQFLVTHHAPLDRLKGLRDSIQILIGIHPAVVLLATVWSLALVVAVVLLNFLAQEAASRLGGCEAVDWAAGLTWLTTGLPMSYAQGMVWVSDRAGRIIASAIYDSLLGSGACLYTFLCFVSLHPLLFVYWNLTLHHCTLATFRPNLPYLPLAAFYLLDNLLCLSLPLYYIFTRTSLPTLAYPYLHILLIHHLVTSTLNWSLLTILTYPFDVIAHTRFWDAMQASKTINDQAQTVVDQGCKLAMQEKELERLRKVEVSYLEARKGKKKGMVA